MKKSDSPERRLAVENELKDYLNKGSLCVLELYRTPEKHQSEGYGMVWTECRRMMADFYRDQVGLFDSPAVDGQLQAMSEPSSKAGGLLDKIKEKELDKDSKLILLEELSGVEKETEAGLEKLIALAS